MKHLIKPIFAVAFACCCISLHAQSEAEMKAWTEYMTPSDIHKMIAKSDGEWNAEMNMWMAPGAPPTKAMSSCTNKMILGGRYQQSNYAGTMNGMPFEGVSTLAYDNSLKKFINTWIDNMGTGLIVMEGTWDNASNSMITKGKETDPITGKEISIRQVFKIIDDNTHSMEMYMTPVGGKEYKNMEIKLTRKK
jgi:Protein of unknown function (DUF1579)